MIIEKISETLDNLQKLRQQEAPNDVLKEEWITLEEQANTLLTGLLKNSQKNSIINCLLHFDYSDEQLQRIEEILNE